MRISLIILLCAALQLSYSQSYISSITHFSTEDGLSNDKVNDLHKDASGFIWIGTNEGLNRFDGREFKVFTPENTAGMTIRSIHEIFEDEQGYLWLLKKNENYDQEFKYPEINLYHIHSGEVTTPEKIFGDSLPFKIEEIGFMSQFRDGRFFFFCPAKQKAYTYHSNHGFAEIKIPSNIKYINEIILQEDGHLLIAGVEQTPYTTWVIYKIDTHGKIVAQRLPDLKLSIKENDQQSWIQFLAINYTVGGKNLAAYNYFYPALDNKDAEPIPYENRIDQTEWNPDQELFWLKGEKQLKVVKPDGTLVFEKEEKLEHKAIPILFDGPTTWLSTGRNGFMAIVLQPNHFANFRFFDLEFDNSTRGIYQDVNGKTWISTISGRAQFNRQGQILHTERDAWTFSPFQEDDLGNIWYYKGDDLVKHDLATGVKKGFHVEQHWVSRWAFFAPNDKEFWLSGYNGNGRILNLNRETGAIKAQSTLPSDINIEFIIYEYIARPDGQVWLCTNQGLYILDANGKYLTSYNEEHDLEDPHYLPSRATHHLYEDSEGVVWLASGDAGLLKLKKGKGKSADQPGGLILEKQYTIEDGLSSNSLHAVYEDDHDYLWISSDEGLMQFDKRSEKVSKYYTEQGIPHNEFNRIAHFQDKEGYLYFGGLLGVTRFHPKHFSKARVQKSEKPLVIADFRQFSGELGEFEDRTTELMANNTIRLQPTDQFFNLKVALLDFESANQTHYQYRINGLYDWQNSTDGNLSISGLPYGNHDLEIRAFNASQQQAANELSISIKALRPFYLRAWFLIAIAAAISFGIWYFIKRRTRRLLLQQETQQLKTLDQMKTRFFTNIAHELRTPLTLIGIPLERLMKNPEGFSKEEMMQFLKSAHTNQQQLNQMVNEILDLSKLESGKLGLNMKPYNLHQFLERVVAAFHTSASAKSISLKFASFVPKTLLVEYDGAKLEMVINNLLSNALKFTPKQGEINVHADWLNDERLQFKIQDSGRGIHADDLPHVFDRYFQTKRKSAALEGGSGIGLAICKEFMELMGGNIQVQSTWNEGSTFSLALPMKMLPGNTQFTNVGEKIVMANEVETQSDASSFNKDRSTILVVEDHPSLRKHLLDILQADYNVVTAGNGKEALEKLTEISCHLILSDVMMPEMDGFTLLEEVKKDQQHCGIPFVMLTARTTLKDKLLGLRVGVDAYMHKPFEIEELLLVIRNLISNAENRSEVGEDITENIPQQEASVQLLPDDLEWLQSVEAIAKREVKNAHYDIDQLTSELLMSRRQVFRRIKKITGLTPKKYFNLIRLQKAKFILETEEVYTLTEICYAVGFENTTHFAKLFEAEFGKRPHDLLKGATTPND